MIFYWRRNWKKMFDYEQSASRIDISIVSSFYFNINRIVFLLIVMIRCILWLTGKITVIENRELSLNPSAHLPLGRQCHSKAKEGRVAQWVGALFGAPMLKFHFCQQTCASKIWVRLICISIANWPICLDW